MPIESNRHIAAKAGFLTCHHCNKTQSKAHIYCTRCHAGVHLRKPYSIQRTWAYLITAAMLYAPANMLPIMKTTFLNKETPNTIIGGVMVLWEHGSYPIAGVIFIASILVPISKLLVLGYLCISVQKKDLLRRKTRAMMYRITEFIGRWSMVDVFVVAVLVSLIQFDSLMSVYPGVAALAFAGLVISSMLAAMSFDPRLIWDFCDTDE